MSFVVPPLVTNFAVRATAAYLQQLRTNEFRTKAMTAGLLNLISEILQQHFARVPRKRVDKDASLLTRLRAYFKITDKAFKMGLYGLLVAAPLGHFLVKGILLAFEHKKDPVKSMLVGATSMLVTAPLQVGLVLSAQSVFDGAQSRKAVVKDVKSMFLPVLIVTYLTIPPAIAYSHARFPLEFEAPFINVVQFMVATFFGSIGLAAAQRAKKQTKKDKDQ